MQDVDEVRRLPSPAPRPQSLAFDGEMLWMGSIETQRIYCIDPVQWRVREEAPAPGKPWGIAALGDELRVICGETEEDHRIIRRFIPGHGFKKDVIPCPDDTGSQLGYDGDRLYVSQWYNRRIISIDETGKPGTIVNVPHGICGQVIFGGVFYLLTTDDEASDKYFLTRVDARNGASRSEDVARVPFAGRALAHDGHRFWTNHREQNEIVAFTAPL